MRSFPILWQLTRTRNHISVHAHTEFGFVLLSFTPEQRGSPSDQSISIREGWRERGRSCFIIQRGGLGVLVRLTFPSVRTVYLSVLRIIYIKLLVTVCIAVWDKQIQAGRIYTCVFGRVCVCVCVWDRLTSGKPLMLTIMSWGDFMETCPSWLRGNFPSCVVTIMWSRAPKQIQIIVSFNRRQHFTFAMYNSGQNLINTAESVVRVITNFQKSNRHL